MQTYGLKDLAIFVVATPQLYYRLTCIHKKVDLASVSLSEHYYVPSAFIVYHLVATQLSGQEIDMNPMDTMVCFSDSKVE